MTKLDGLVLQFSLKMFAETNIAETNENLTKKISEEIESLTAIKVAKEQELLQVEADYKKLLKRLILLDDDSMVEELIKEEQSKYQQNSGKLKSDIAKLVQRISSLRVNINNIRKLNVNANLYAKMHDVRADRGLIKTMVDEYIENVIIYRMHKLWFLVVIKYKNGVELWGKIKNARYKNDELFYDECCCRYGVEFQTWVVDNTNHSFIYDKERKIIIYQGGNDLYPDLEQGEYDYERMNQYMMESQNMGSFSLYLYEDLSSNKKIEEIEEGENEVTDVVVNVTPNRRTIELL